MAYTVDYSVGVAHPSHLQQVYGKLVGECLRPGTQAHTDGQVVNVTPTAAHRISGASKTRHRLITANFNSVYNYGGKQMHRCANCSHIFLSDIQPSSFRCYIRQAQH